MLADYVGVAHAVSVPHATAALHLALAALGVGPGDEVIAPDVAWIASVAPIVYVGAEPVLVDILPDTWCLDPDAVEAAIGPRTKEILGVDLYGSTCDSERLRVIADRHGLALIEDAAEALGSVHHGPQGGRASGACRRSVSMARRRWSPAKAACSPPTTRRCSTACCSCATMAANPAIGSSSIPRLRSSTG